MENKKKIWIVIGILVLYFIIMVLFFGMNQLKKKIYYTNFILSPDTCLRYEDGKFKMISKEEIKKQNYQIYVDHQAFSKGTLQYTNDKWYAFDDHDQSLSLPNDFFAYSGNMKVDVMKFQVNEMNSEEIIEAKKLLKQQEIVLEPIFTKTLKVTMDLNNDSKEETIYLISNALGMDEQSTYFSIAYLKINDTIEMLIHDVSSDLYDVPSLNIKEIIDFNQDQNYEMIFEKIYFDQIGTCHEIVSYDQTMKTCELGGEK